MPDPRIDPVIDEIMSTLDSGYWATKWAANFAERILAAIDKAATITTVEELDALPVGSVAIGWAFDGHTPYLRSVSARGRTVWGCVGTQMVYESADLLNKGFKARVIHWGTE